MNNMPEVKLGIVAVSRDCFPESLSVNRRKALIDAYTKKYDAAEHLRMSNLYRRKRDPYGSRHSKTLRKQDVMHFVYILETSDQKFLRHCLQNILTDRRCSWQQQKRQETIWYRDSGDAYCGMLNASYNLTAAQMSRHIFRNIL